MATTDKFPKLHENDEEIQHTSGAWCDELRLDGLALPPTLLEPNSKPYYTAYPLFTPSLISARCLVPFESSNAGCLYLCICNFLFLSNKQIYFYAFDSFNCFSKGYETMLRAQLQYCCQHLRHLGIPD